MAKQTLNNKSLAEENICIHCGDLCGTKKVSDGEALFCCAGCHTVYTLLHQSGLGTYYTLDDKPGVKPGVRPGPKVDQSRFDYLDKPSVRERLLDFDNSDMGRITFSIPQIHCSSCIWLLENLFKIEPRVHSTVVNFQKRRVSIMFDSQALALSELVAVLASLGYEPELMMSSLDSDRPDKSFRTLYAQIAISGFCFGNVMLLSFPHYLGLESVGELWDGRFFDYLKALLSLPVIFFGAMNFYLSAWRGLKHRQINMDLPIAIGIVVLSLRSFYEIFIESSPGYLDSLCALVFLLLLGRLFQKKTYDWIAFDRDYRAYLPVAVTKISDGQESTIPLEDSKPGDRLLIRGQEIIPADSVIIKGQALINYAFVTGESDPVRAVSGDRIYAGGRQIGEALEIEITSEPSRSYLFQLWEEIEQVVTNRSTVSSIANRVSKYFTPTVIGLALLSAIYWWFYNPDLIWAAASSVLIVACPCALALSSPFALGSAQRLMGKAGVYLRDSAVIEQMASLTTLVFDKTGTITRSTIEEPQWHGPTLTAQQKSYVLALVRQSIHPLSVALRQHLDCESDLTAIEFLEELGKGTQATVDNHKIRVGSPAWVGASELPEGIGMRVYVAIDDQVTGYYLFDSRHRPGLAELLKSLRKYYKLVLLSGDNESERSNMSKLFEKEEKESELLFNQSPYDKLNKIVSLEQDGEAVGMIGDGLNDAGALKAARIGLTIVEESSSFSPASDGVVDARSFELLPNILIFSRDTMKVIKASIALSFVYNLVGLGFAIQGNLSPLIAAILMPISSVSVVLFATVATRYYARVRGLNS